MNITIVGSHLLEPTHHSLAALIYIINKKVNVEILAKHPIRYNEIPTPPVKQLILDMSQIWQPNADIVHAIGGGETAIRVAKVLDPKTPMIVSFVGGADLTRQLKQIKLREGYAELFRRVNYITYPENFGRAQLEIFGAPITKMVHIPAALPSVHYSLSESNRDNQALMAGRPINRKNHRRAIDVALHSKHLRRLITVGRLIPGVAPDDKITQLDSLTHIKLMELLHKNDVLLQTGDWYGDEVDSLPIIVLEALAMGIPVVSTPLPGVSELKKSLPQFVKLSSTISGLAKGLDEIFSSPLRSDRKRIQQWVFRHHGLMNIADLILKLYKKIFNG